MSRAQTTVVLDGHIIDSLILPKVLDAASRYASRPSDADMQQLVDRRAMTPFFV